MSRSIHTTKKALAKERRFAANDDLADKASITELEKQDIQKSVYKINETWKRDASSRETIGHAKIALLANGPKRVIQKRKGRLSENTNAAEQGAAANP